MSNNLKKVIAEAKKIRKSQPAMEWKTALKEAGLHLSKAIKPVVHVAKKSAKKGIKRGLISLAKSKHLNGLNMNGIKNPKTKLEHIVQGNYGYGWDDLTSHDNKKEANAEKKVYDLNESYPHRVISRRVKIQGIGSWKKGSTLFVEKNEIPKRVSKNHPTLVAMRQKKKRGTRKKGTFKHFVQIGAVLSYVNPDMANELKAFGDSDSQLYFSRKLPIIKNLEKKYKKGTYDFEKSIKLLRYFVDDLMQKYHKQYMGRGKWFEMLSVPDRNLLAREFAEDILVEFESGNFTI